MKKHYFDDYFICNSNEINELKPNEITKEVLQDLKLKKISKRSSIITVLKNIVLAVSSDGTAELFVGVLDEDFYIKNSIDVLLGDLLSIKVSAFRYSFLETNILETISRESKDNLNYLELGKFNLRESNIDSSMQNLFSEWNQIYFEEFLILRFIIDFLNCYLEEKNNFNFQSLTDLINVCKIKMPSYKVTKKSTEFESTDFYTEVAWFIPRKTDDFIPLFNNYFENNDMKDFIYYYESDNIPQIMLALLYENIKRGNKLKICQNCGRLFAANKSDEKYCSRIYDKKSCKQIAKASLRKTSDLTKKYNCINTLLANKINKANLTAEEETLYRDELFKFRDKAKEYKEKLKNKEISEETYSEWLDSYKKRNELKNNAHNNETE